MIRPSTTTTVDVITVVVTIITTTFSSSSGIRSYSISLAVFYTRYRFRNQTTPELPRQLIGDKIMLA
ncbi:uncharacterized protein DFL_009086 [Arthrobotrys flagrans]|uniref:Uncharacterized protein n=1 Tax=Arthrobotrys flagrans TaxID=97331 RepID=A0A436ZR14_ARTFL|nr:hypothetical protein DFL_009086 [Arthrobotrys flagrans]